MSWRYFKKTDVSISRALALLQRPVISEKATFGAERNEVTFRVTLDATKPEIRSAIEKIFKVKVESVTTSRLQGKQKRFRGRIGRRKETKKAFVRLAKGESIDIGSVTS